MLDQNQEKAFCDGFLFGQIAFARAIEITITETDAQKLWDMLRDVAAGKTTIVSTAAQMLVKHPNAEQWIKEYLDEHVGKMIALERQWAEIVYRRLHIRADQ